MGQAFRVMQTMNYVDWIIVAILLLGAWRGYHRGGINTFTGLVRYLVGLAVAAVYARPLAYLLEDRFGIITANSKRLAGMLPLPEPVIATSMGGVKAGELARSLEGLALPGFLRERLVEQVLTSRATTLGEAVSYGLAAMLVQAIVFVLLVLLVVVVIRLLSGVVTRGISHTVLGSLNRLLGTVTGVAVNGAILAVLLGLASPFLAQRGGPQGGSITVLADALDQSILVPYLVQVFGIISNKLIKIF
ncbi:hypothetical protein SY88_01780 [Clostridiales bacterium PH28_bin88]|nr:hypothetical protein SY88_01780 [Clostridiales bacterium PH28_bin88]